MIHPVTKLMVRPMKQNKTFSHKLMTIVFKLLHITLGLDFGFAVFQKSKSQIISKVFTFLMCVVISTIVCVFDETDHLGAIFVNIYMCLHLVCVFLLLTFKRGTTFYDFMSILPTIDFKIGLDSSIYQIEWKISLAIISSVACRCITDLIYFLHTGDLYVKPIWVAILNNFTYVSTDLVMITYAFVYYSIKCRLSSLLMIIDTRKDYRDYTSLQWTYKYIADTTEKFKKAYDKMMLYALLYRVPETMLNIYGSIWLLKFERTAPLDLALCLRYVLGMQALSITLAPAIYAGMVSTKAENIKITLHNKLLTEKDDVRRAQIAQFIKYAEARPLALSVYKLIPLNAHLISIVINFCVTYLIVIIQFSS